MSPYPLPQAYTEQMRCQLGSEADAFLASYEADRAYGLRLNPLKLAPASPAVEHMRGLFRLRPVPWCAEGYYYDDAARPGRHPYHAAGLYYIQEPSAMSAADLLRPEPGDVVLDLAAAPGGKSTQIAGRLQGRGLLVANEIHPARAKILSENIERFGVRNAWVTNHAPDRLARQFPERFDKIMLDAPCSGEGMFRKDSEAIREWSPAHVEMCAARQRDIVREAVAMLKPGGVLAYSTCTFNRRENEDVIAWLLDAYPQMRLQRSERIWPHRAEGEGHYVAVLEKADEPPTASAPPEGGSAAGSGRRRAARPSAAAADAVRLFDNWAREAVPGLTLPPGEPVLFGEQLYWLPLPDGRWSARDLDGLKALRPGLHLATVKKNRAEPAHALAMALRPEDRADLPTYSADAAEIERFLRGEALPAPPDASGWLPVAVDGYPLGWGKAADGQMKNHLPKGLRWPG